MVLIFSINQKLNYQHFLLKAKVNYTRRENWYDWKELHGVAADVDSDLIGINTNIQVRMSSTTFNKLQGAEEDKTKLLGNCDQCYNLLEKKIFPDPQRESHLVPGLKHFHKINL